MQATQIIEQIQSHALIHASDKLKIVPDNFPIGQYVPQGDINILRLATLPEGVIPLSKNAQLAPGTSRGSRHCIRAEDLVHCEFYNFVDANPLEGPIIVLKERILIEHPEHADYSFPAGIIAIGYQRRLGDEIRRSQD